MKNKKLITALIITSAIISACSTKSTQNTTDNTTDKSSQLTQPTTEPTLTNSTEPTDLDKELNSITITDPTQELLNSEK